MAREVDADIGRCWEGEYDAAKEVVDVMSWGSGRGRGGEYGTGSGRGYQVLPRG